MKKILLVVLPYLVQNSQSVKKTTKKNVRSFLAFPYGALTISSYIHKNSSHTVRILDLNINLQNNTPEDVSIFFKKFLESNAFNVIGFSMSYDSSFTWLKDLSSISNLINSKTTLVVGGPSASTAYKEILELIPYLDGVCYLEGEKAFLGLLNSKNIPNFLKNNNSWVTKEKAGDLLFNPELSHVDLDDTIDVDYGLVDQKSYNMKEAFSPFVKHFKDSKQFFIVTSRGCPFKCVFCAEPSLHGSSMRYASVESVINHVKFLVCNYGLTTLTIYDDQILLNKPRAKEIFRQLALLNIRVEMPNGVTLTYIDDEMAMLMSRAGVDTIFLAIESGSKRVLKDIIKKPIAFHKIKPVVEILKKYKIFTCAFFVIGLPGETKKDREETRGLAYDMGFDWCFFNYATPVRGSELYETVVSNGVLKEEYLSLGAIDMSEYVLDTPEISKSDIEDFIFDINIDINFINNSNFRMGNMELAIMSFLEVISRHEGHPIAHYMLGKCYKVERSDELSKKHFKRYVEIVTADKSWKSICIKFNLDFKKSRQ
jgi:radical SAM superfamily enzyme YgiQ (UPF0313 family)